MSLVTGMDSSMQSCKVIFRDVVTGQLVRHGRAAHPDGTSVKPELWWQAFQSAIVAAGGLDDVVGISVAGQQHGIVCLGEIIATSQIGKVRDIDLSVDKSM